MKPLLTPAFWKSNARWVARMVLVIWIAFALLVRRLSPIDLEQALLRSPYRCPLKWWTGLQCAFCGMTHSWIAMFRGEFGIAQKENFFGPLLWFLALLLMVLLALGRRMPLLFSHPRFIMLGVIVLSAYTIFRNLIPGLNP